MLDALQPRTVPPGALAARPLLSARATRLLALGAIVALAVALRFANLASLGYVNHYYSAGVTAMLHSWRNFFFVAAEPGGSVTIDKPPLGLWIQAASAGLMGVNTLGVLLPQLLAGCLSVILLYHLVRRSFGTAGGLIAALTLALTPVAVATDRNNTMDSTLILTLLLAAWAFLRAAENRRLRDLLLGAILVGLGFNIKMLQAYLALPAFYAAYFLGCGERLLPKIGRLALATVVILAVSLAWVAAVELTPADQRPYVGSSSDNSELSLIVGYNGMQRLLGMVGRGGARTMGSLFQAGNTPGRPTGFGGGPGMSGTGTAGPWRLFIPPLGKEVGWLLPFGLFSMALIAVRSRPRWPLAPRHQAVILWGGWLLVGGAFFSIAGFFHEYYLSMLAAPLAALVGAGLAELWQLRGEQPWIALPILVVTTAATAWLQFGIASAFVSNFWWLPALIGLGVAGALFLAAAPRPDNLLARAGFAGLVAVMLVTPGLWAYWTNANSSSNQSLPAAYDGRSSGPANRGSLSVNQELLNYLQPRTKGMTYLMAVPSAMQGADYVLATGRGVLYLGGFMGQDRVKTGAQLAELVAAGELRYIYWDTRRGGFGGFSPAQSDVSAFLASSCSQVQGYNAETRNSGAPDGVNPGAGAFQGFGSLQVTLYDCASQN